ncbi:hypothetical protein MBLNU459_g3848t1 [Dothideomycetes sp. NU459]
MAFENLSNYFDGLQRILIQWNLEHVLSLRLLQEDRPALPHDDEFTMDNGEVDHSRIDSPLEVDTEIVRDAQSSDHANQILPLYPGTHIEQLYGVLGLSQTSYRMFFEEMNRYLEDNRAMEGTIGLGIPSGPPLEQDWIWKQDEIGKQDRNEQQDQMGKQDQSGDILKTATSGECTSSTSAELSVGVANYPSEPLAGLTTPQKALDAQFAKFIVCHLS